MTSDDALILLGTYIQNGCKDGLSAETCQFVYERVVANLTCVAMDATSQDGSDRNA